MNAEEKDTWEETAKHHKMQEKDIKMQEKQDLKAKDSTKGTGTRREKAKGNTQENATTEENGVIRQNSAKENQKDREE